MPVEPRDRRREVQEQSQLCEAEGTMGSLQEQIPRTQDTPSRLGVRCSETGTPPIEFSFNRQEKRQTPSSERQEPAEENSHKAKQAWIDKDSQAQHVHQLDQANPHPEDKALLASTQQPNPLQKLTSTCMSRRNHAVGANADHIGHSQQCHAHLKQQAGSYANTVVPGIKKFEEEQLRSLKIPFELKSHKVIKLEATSSDGDSSMDDDERNDVVAD